MRNKPVLLSMFEIYGKPKIDWMGFKVSEENYLTYHHIIKAEDGGDASIENGAILTRKAHTQLHTLEGLDPTLYQEYQYWFKLINDMKCPPTFEIMQIMYALKERLDYDISNKKNIKEQNKNKKLVLKAKGKPKNEKSSNNN